MIRGELDRNTPQGRVLVVDETLDESGFRRPVEIYESQNQVVPHPRLALVEERSMNPAGNVQPVFRVLLNVLVVATGDLELDVLRRVDPLGNRSRRDRGERRFD